MLQVSYRETLRSLALEYSKINVILISQEPSCNQAVELKHHLVWPLNIINATQNIDMLLIVCILSSVMPVT